MVEWLAVRRETVGIEDIKHGRVPVSGIIVKHTFTLFRVLFVCPEICTITVTKLKLFEIEY